MSAEYVELTIDGRAVRARDGVSVAAALLDAQQFAFRLARSGGARGPLCGMGVCYECRVTIDDVAHQRACMTTVRQGMRIRTAGAGA